MNSVKWYGQKYVLFFALKCTRAWHICLL